jgi:hypothetical protein
MLKNFKRKQPVYVLPMLHLTIFRRENKRIKNIFSARISSFSLWSVYILSTFRIIESLLIKIHSVRTRYKEYRYIPGRPLKVIELWDTNDYLHFLSSVNKDDDDLTLHH